MLEWLFGKTIGDKPLTMADFYEIKAQCEAEVAREDALFDQWYDERSHLFMETRMMRLTEVDQPQPMPVISEAGYADFDKYLKERNQ